MGTVRLDKYDNSWYKPGNCAKRVVWLLVSIMFFRIPLPVPSGFKCALLRLFGARVGKGVTVKPSVNIKYPWFLKVGDHSWIGEGAWLDSLGEICIGENVCVSQGAYIFTGNHNYKKETFDLFIQPVFVEEGAWVGAKAVVCPGVRVGKNAVLAAASVATKDLESGKIYQGNPAIEKRTREIDGV